MELKNVVIVDGVRSAFGRGARGTLAATRMDEVAGTVIKSLLKRNPNVDPYDIEDCVCGNVGNNGELSGMTSNTVARIAELPPEMSSATVNRQCGSSMQALHMISRSIMTGAGEIGVAAGVERVGRAYHGWPGSFNRQTRLFYSNDPPPAGFCRVSWLFFGS